MGGKEPGAAPGKPQFVAEGLEGRDAGVKAHPSFGQGKRLQDIRHGFSHAVVEGVPRSEHGNAVPLPGKGDSLDGVLFGMPGDGVEHVASAIGVQVSEEAL